MPYMGLQASFTAGEISPNLAVRVDLAKYQTGCRTLENMLVHPHGGASKRTGFEYLFTLPDPARLMPFVFSSTQAYVLAWTEKRMFVITAEGPVLDADGNAYSIATPYTYAQARGLGYVQSADVIYLASYDFPPYKLSRYGHTDWRLEALTFAPKIAAPTGLTGWLYDNRSDAERNADGGNSKAWRYVVTAVAENGEESLPSAAFSVAGPENMRNNCYPKISWSAHPQATEYRVYQEQSGKFGYIGSCDPIGSPYFDAKNFAPTMTDTPPQAKNPFTDGNYPGTVCFFQQRLVFGGSRNRPQTIWFSRSGNYENFSTSTPLKDDDAIEVTIASNEVSLIRWMVALRSLLVGTSGVEWEVSGAGDAGAVTPTAISIVPQSYRGSADIDAQVVGNTIMHVSRTYREIRDLLYDFGSDSYGGTDRAILATHLFERNKITDWTYQQSPDSIIWCVRDDGALLGHTYLREHEVFAWHRHVTDGAFQAVCCIPGVEDDDLFVVVRRTVGGAEQYLMERMKPRYVDEESTLNAFFVDAGLTYRGEPAQKIYGLDHLWGREVAILADGAVVPRQVVRELEAGKIGIELPYAASVVHVGLPYRARLQTMSLEPDGIEGGTTVGRKKLINKVCVFFRATNSAFIGTSWNDLDEVKWRINEAPGQPPRPHTEDAWIYTGLGYENQAYACVESREPLPCTVLAVVPEVSVNAV